MERPLFVHVVGPYQSVNFADPYNQGVQIYVANGGDCQLEVVVRRMELFPERERLDDSTFHRLSPES